MYRNDIDDQYELQIRKNNQDIDELGKMISNAIDSDDFDLDYVRLY
jgi:hypothetical protein